MTMLLVLLLAAMAHAEITLPCNTCGSGVTCADGIATLNADCSVVCVVTTTTSTSTTSTTTTTTTTTSTTTTTFPYLYSMADAGINVGTQNTGGSANSTVGVAFLPQTQVTITGCRFFWPGVAAGAKTVRCRIYRGGSSQANVDVSAPASDGIVTGTFGSPYTVSSGNVNVSHTISMWVTDSSKFIEITSYTGPAAPYAASPGINYTNVGKFGTGDVNPTSSGGFYPIDPVY